MIGWQAHVLTLFPEMFPGPLSFSVTELARKNNLWSLHTYDIRKHAAPPHYTVDDRPFGGGAGMLMRADVIAKALDDNNLPQGRNIYLTPKGRPLDQNLVSELAQASGVTLLCGRYEGVDARLFEEYAFEEVSVGDYVLAGGEIAAMSLIEACVRTLPGALGHCESALYDSFHNNLLEHAQYTRPRTWRNHTVPEILLSGNHKKINEWRHTNSLEVTRTKRPDLIRSREQSAKHLSDPQKNPVSKPDASEQDHE